VGFKMKDDSEFVKALIKCKKNRENWYADELLEDITRIQENVKNKELSKLEYIAMLNGIVRKINKIKEKINNE
jgi:glycyl-tRNA synthetase (class II)